MSPTLETFSAHLCSTASPHTASAYLSDAERFEAVRRGRPVTMDLYEEWVGTLAGLNPQTVGRRMAGVRRWLAFLGRHGDSGALAVLTVLRSGYRVARGPREADRASPRPVTETEWREAKLRAPAWGRALMDLLWWAGPRISEVLGDPRASVPISPMCVRHGILLTEQGWTETVGKGGRRRAICVPSGARQLLAGWVQGKRPEAPLFPSPQDPSRPVTASAVRQMLRRIGVGHPHAFRHAFKARLRRAGVAEEVIRALMGHGPRSVTDRYGSVSLEELLEAVELMAGAS